MDDYLDRFKAMVEELRAHPDVVVTHFNVFPGISDRLIKRIRYTLGYELDVSILSFFQATNGLQLRWIHKSNKHYKSLASNDDSHRPPLTVLSVLEDNNRVDGCVNILPIESIFLDNDIWKGTIWWENFDNESTTIFNGKDYPRLDFKRSIRLFDFYSQYNDAAFVLYFKSPNPPVVRGEDVRASYDDSEIVTFAAYMEQILRKKGQISGRKPLNDLHQIDLGAYKN